MVRFEWIDRRVLIGALAALAVAAVPAAIAQADAPTGARLQVYNDLYLGGAVDAELRVMAPRAGQAGATIALAENLHKGEDTGFVNAPAGKARLEVKTPGGGRAAITRRSLRLQPGHDYCAFVLGLGEARWITVIDATRRARVDPGDGDVCEDLLTWRVYVPVD